MTQITKQSLTDASAIAWIIDNHFVTETLKPFEFVKHRFLIDYMADQFPDIVSTKCSQIGATLAETFDDFHMAGKRRLNVLHTLQNKDVIRGFVVPKVDPVIEHNPGIKEMLKSDSQNLKQFNTNYVFFRGASSESQAINISVDALKIDELDRSNPQVVEMLQSRLDYSEVKIIRRFSNPSVKGYGVDAYWKDSDQRHWFVKCPHCGHTWYIDFYYREDEKNHYVSVEQEIYACGKCHKELSTSDRIRGQWVVKYPSRSGKRHGYWFSQMMSPWFTAKEIVQKWRENSPEYFHNFVLGRAYQATDLSVTRETILEACSPSIVAKRDVVLGVDNGIRKTWVAGTPDGIFAHGQTESWDDIERMLLEWNAVAVLDPNPYPLDPKRLMTKYKNRVFICYFKQDRSGMSIATWGEKAKAGVVYADRTRILDLIAREITNKDIVFRESPHLLEDVIAHWDNIYRKSEEDEKSRFEADWIKKDNKPSDYPFAIAYYRLGLAKVLGSSGSTVFVGEPTGTTTPVAASPFTPSLEQSSEEGSDWRTT